MGGRNSSFVRATGDRGVHPARLPFRRGHIGMGHLPLHTDDDLQHQKCCNHPVCGSVMHDLQRTPLAAMGEEALGCHRGRSLVAKMTPSFDGSSRGMTCEFCKSWAAS